MLQISLYYKKNMVMSNSDSKFWNPCNSTNIYLDLWKYFANLVIRENFNELVPFYLRIHLSWNITLHQLSDFQGAKLNRVQLSGWALTLYPQQQFKLGIKASSLSSFSKTRKEAQGRICINKKDNNLKS